MITELARGRSGRKRSEDVVEYSDEELHAVIDEWRIGLQQRR